MEINAIPQVKADIEIIDPPPGSPNNVSKGRDDGTLRCVGRSFGWINKHSTFQSCVRNALEADSHWDKLNIVGHGNEGYIETGWGQRGTPDPKKNFLSLNNFTEWEPFVRKFDTHAVPKLRIFGCYVGAGEKGADFLYEIAKLTNKKVVAFNALIECSERWGTSYDPRGVWVKATPQKRPTPVDSPIIPFSTTTRSTSINLSINGKIVGINIDQFTNVEVTSYSQTDAVSKVRNIDSGIIKNALISMFATEPHSNIGRPLAVITADIKFIINTKKGLVEFKYTVFSDKIMISEDGKTAYYVRNNIRDFY